ncbi:MAG TPA: hypothetical protein VJ743_14220 [Albitalea sp.]|nr:hypothetical protein [Albitalea sp.]
MRSRPVDQPVTSTQFRTIVRRKETAMWIVLLLVAAAAVGRAGWSLWRLCCALPRRNADFGL